MVVLWRVELALRGRILSVFSHNCRMSNLLSENWRVRSYFWHRVNAKYQNTTNIDGREQRASAQYTLSNSKRSRSLTSKPFDVRNFDIIRVNLTPSFLPVPFSCYLFNLTLTRHGKSMWTPHPKDNECSLFLSNSMNRLSNLKFQQTIFFRNWTWILCPARSRYALRSPVRMQRKCSLSARGIWCSTRGRVLS